MILSVARISFEWLDDQWIMNEKAFGCNGRDTIRHTTNIYLDEQRKVM
jgi:hypothetical protein